MVKNINCIFTAPQQKIISEALIYRFLLTCNSLDSVTKAGIPAGQFPKLPFLCSLKDVGKMQLCYWGHLLFLTKMLQNSRCAYIFSNSLKNILHVLRKQVCFIQMTVKIWKGGEMVQYLRTLSALPGNLSLVPSNFSSRDPVYILVSLRTCVLVA